MFSSVSTKIGPHSNLTPSSFRFRDSGVIYRPIFTKFGTQLFRTIFSSVIGSKEVLISEQVRPLIGFYFEYHFFANILNVFR